jgi:hypothetical protein
MGNRNDPEKDAKLYWVLVTSYLLRCIGKLSAGAEAELGRYTIQAGAGDWKSLVERELEIDEDFVRRLYEACTDRMEENRAFLFMLRGFGCPDPVGRIAEVTR